MQVRFHQHLVPSRPLWEMHHAILYGSESNVTEKLLTSHNISNENLWWFMIKQHQVNFERVSAKRSIIYFIVPVAQHFIERICKIKIQLILDFLDQTTNECANRLIKIKMRSSSKRKGKWQRRYFTDVVKGGKNHELFVIFSYITLKSSAT